MIEKKPTYCRICEPCCGVLATVEDGKITKIEPNRDHVHSRGHFCKKASAMVDVQYDTDRILQPMKRIGTAGEFVPISWSQAYEEICNKLTATRNTHGNESVASYVGNPVGFAYATSLTLRGFHKTLGIKWKYDLNAEDGNALIVKNILLYGSAGVNPRPDVWRTDFLLILGANPATSHGSSISEPRIAEAIKSVRLRGGRVVVIDPRRTETARTNEYIPINAGTDAYLLCAMIHVIFAEGLVDTAFADNYLNELEQLRAATLSCTPDWAQGYTGIPADLISQLARDFAGSKSAATHGRVGISTQRFGTLSTILLDAVSILTGNLDKQGGNSFGWGIFDMTKMVGGSYGKRPSRTTNLPDVGGTLASSALPGDILEPGAGQIKALFMIAANPALASPATGERLEQALESLDLFVSLDIYMNETNRFADYILPSATMYEREDVPLFAMTEMLRPNIFATEAVVSPAGEAKEDWRILDDICSKLGYGGALPSARGRLLAKWGLKITPKRMMDILIRTSEIGDKFGLRPGGLSIKKLLKKYPNGQLLRETMPTGVIDSAIKTQDSKIDLAQPVIIAEIQRLKDDQFYQDAAYPLRAFGQRETFTHNSWMHNTPTLMTSRREHYARVHPTDAAQRGIESGQKAKIRSAYGEIELQVRLSEEVKPGNVSIPHGWGHGKGGWRHANNQPGANVNVIASDNPSDMDPVSGISTLNGIPIEIIPIPANCRAT